MCVFLKYVKIMICRCIFSGIYFGTQIFLKVSNFFDVEEVDYEDIVAG